MKGIIIALPLLGSLAFGQSVTTNCTEFLGNVRCRSNYQNWIYAPPIVRPNETFNRQLEGLRRSLETRAVLDSMRLQQEILRRDIESFDFQKRLEKEKRNQSWKWIEDADELSY